MSRIFMNLCLAVFITTGCQSVKTITPDEWGGASTMALNQEAAQRDAELTLSDGRILKVQSLQITPDQTSWLDQETDRVISVPTSTIIKVRFVSHGRGALQGMGLGLLSGVLIGAIVGAASGSDAPCVQGSWFSCWSFSAGEKAAILGVSFGVMGLPLGLMIGAISGNQTIYRFEEQAPPMPLISIGKPTELSGMWSDLQRRR